MIGRRILVVAAHSDDEALGCGGTIAAHTGAGGSVSVLFMTDGVGARGTVSDEAARRHAAAAAALAELGVSSFENLDFPDNRMDAVPLLDVVQAIEPVVRKFRPDTILTHHGGDLNVDHRVTHEAVMTALRPQPGETFETILTFEVASSTEWRTPNPAAAFVPHWYEDISATLEAKRRALIAYATEMRDWPHSRSVEAVMHLARYRGACVGLEAAEAFMLARRIGRRGPLP